MGLNISSTLGNFFLSFYMWYINNNLKKYFYCDLKSMQIKLKSKSKIVKKYIFF